MLNYQRVELASAGVVGKFGEGLLVTWGRCYGGEIPSTGCLFSLCWSLLSMCVYLSFCVCVLFCLCRQFCWFMSQNCLIFVAHKKIEKTIEQLFRTSVIGCDFSMCIRHSFLESQHEVPCGHIGILVGSPQDSCFLFWAPYKAYVREYWIFPQNMANNMVLMYYLHVRILKFPLNSLWQVWHSLT